MGRSLFFKLLGAFTLVIAIGAVVATVLARQATISEFRNYTDRNGQVLAQSLAPALADYYAQNSTWEGVGGLVQDPAAWASTVEMTPTPPSVFSSDLRTSTQEAPDSPGMRHRGMGPGMMGIGMGMSPTQTSGLGSVNAEGNSAGMTGQGGMGPRMGSWQGSYSSGMVDMWSMVGHRVLVADAAGQVVSDSSGEATGAVLSNEQLAGGESIQVAGQTAGTVLVGSAETSPGTPAGDFLRAVNRSILVAMLAAGAAAMVIGGVLFFQITAPVRQLKAASRAIATGELSYRVPVQTQDELGDLAVAFNHMAESLSRVEAQRQQMVADVAHELRTPLSVMQANLEGMQDGLLPLDAEQIASLHEETVLLSRLVADLRLLSLAEAGQLKLERMEVHPGELIRKSTERLSRAAEERGIAMVTDTSPALPSIWADADRISQVIGNLVSNALRYTTSGGTVTVKVEPLTGQQAKEAHPASEVMVSVTDTGSGIPPEDLPHIFDRFYRADKSRTRASGGSGLGLAIVKHIVEAHGGRVWAESPVWAVPAQNSGSRISFTLPATKWAPNPG